MEFNDTLNGRGEDSSKAAETFLTLIPTTPCKNAQNGRKKQEIFFLIPCFSVPFHVAALFSFHVSRILLAPVLFLASITASNYFPGLQSVNRLICRLHILP